MQIVHLRTQNLPSREQSVVSRQQRNAPPSRLPRARSLRFRVLGAVPLVGSLSRTGKTGQEDCGWWFSATPSERGGMDAIGKKMTLEKAAVCCKRDVAKERKGTSRSVYTGVSRRADNGNPG